LLVFHLKKLNPPSNLVKYKKIKIKGRPKISKISPRPN